jgi:hypothetical protein
MKKWFQATEKLLHKEEPERPGLEEDLSQGLTFYKFVVSKLDERLSAYKIAQHYFMSHERVESM